jgi:hypothetical protein
MKVDVTEIINQTFNDFFIAINTQCRFRTLDLFNVQ